MDATLYLYNFLHVYFCISEAKQKGIIFKKSLLSLCGYITYSVFMYFCKSVFLRSKIEVGKDFFGKANCPCLAGGGSGTTVVQLHFKEPRLVWTAIEGRQG